CCAVFAATCGSAKLSTCLTGRSPSTFLVLYSSSLIAADEPPPCTQARRDGRSSFVIVVDHASARIPRALGDLGVAPSELQRHIAWDIGALAVATRVSAA